MNENITQVSNCWNSAMEAGMEDGMEEGGTRSSGPRMQHGKSALLWAGINSDLIKDNKSLLPVLGSHCLRPFVEDELVYVSLACIQCLMIVHQEAEQGHGPFIHSVPPAASRIETGPAVIILQYSTSVQYLLQYPLLYEYLIYLYCYLLGYYCTTVDTTYSTRTTRAVQYSYNTVLYFRTKVQNQHQNEPPARPRPNALQRLLVQSVL